jgi:hypothetical protein
VLRDLTGIGDDASVSFVGRVSALGLGLVHGQSIPPGEMFTVLLPRQSGESIPVRCIAVCCRNCGGPDTYLIGASFTAILNDEYGCDRVVPATAMTNASAAV